MANHIGSVSTGTMRPEDLISSFLWEVKRDHLSRANRNAIRGIESRLNRADETDYFENGDADTDLESLFEILDSVAPEGFYFGANEGDGADYGFWLSSTFVEDFDGLKVDDLSEVPTGYSGSVLHVSDHGNLTLYAYSRGRGREIWGIV